MTNSDPLHELENCVTLLRAVLAGNIVPAEIQNQIDRAQAVLDQPPASVAASIMGRIGGRATGGRKAAAVRINGRKGGRPRKYPKGE